MSEKLHLQGALRQEPRRWRPGIALASMATVLLLLGGSQRLLRLHLGAVASKYQARRTMPLACLWDAFGQNLDTWLFNGAPGCFFPKLRERQVKGLGAAQRNLRGSRRHPTSPTLRKARAVEFWGSGTCMMATSAATMKSRRPSASQN